MPPRLSQRGSAKPSLWLHPTQASLCSPIWNAGVHCQWRLLPCDFIVAFQCLTLFWFGSYCHILSCGFFFPPVAAGLLWCWKLLKTQYSHAWAFRGLDKEAEKLLLFFCSKRSYNMLSIASLYSWRLDSLCWCTLWLAVQLLTSKGQSKGLGWNRLIQLLSQEGFFTTLYKDEVTWS